MYPVENLAKVGLLINCLYKIIIKQKLSFLMTRFNKKSFNFKCV